MVEKMPRSIGIRCGVKITWTGSPATSRQGLLDLRRVAMLADAVGGHAFVAFGKVRRQLRRSARAGDAALAVDDDVVQFDRLARDERGQAENAGLRIAAGIGDQLGGVDLVAVDFGQAVDRLGKIRQVVVALAVPLGVDLRIAQPVIGARDR